LIIEPSLDNNINYDPLYESDNKSSDEQFSDTNFSDEQFSDKQSFDEQSSDEKKSNKKIIFENMLIMSSKLENKPKNW
jgi:hypothetical protein